MRSIQWLMVFIAVGSFFSLRSATAEQAESWKLAWSDEFDVDGRLDPEKWGYERGFVRNREVQWYQPDNAFCEDGMLVIEGRREAKPVQVKRRGEVRTVQTQYTSSSVTTWGKFSWLYGRLEVRAKIVAEEGLWPAIWTLGERGRWPANGEVDLMEYYHHSILANAAWRGQKDIVWDSVKKPMADFDAEWAKEFHIWRMDWDAKRIVLSIDDQVINEIETTAANQTADPPPFAQPHYLLLNLAIGGTNGGDPAAATYPSRYLVDYVRVYQAVEESGEARLPLSQNSATMSYAE